VRDTSTGNGKVVVNRSMSLDGSSPAPRRDGLDLRLHGPIEDEFPEIMAATAPCSSPADLRGGQAYGRRPKPPELRRGS